MHPVGKLVFEPTVKVFFGEYIFKEYIKIFSPPQTVADFMKYQGRADYMVNGKIRYSKH